MLGVVIPSSSSSTSCSFLFPAQPPPQKRPTKPTQRQLLLFLPDLSPTHSLLSFGLISYKSLTQGEDSPLPGRASPGHLWGAKASPFAQMNVLVHPRMKIHQGSGSRLGIFRFWSSIIIIWGSIFVGRLFIFWEVYLVRVYRKRLSLCIYDCLMTEGQLGPTETFFGERCEGGLGIEGVEKALLINRLSRRPVIGGIEFFVCRPV